MPLRRRLSHSIGQSRPSDGTREHNDSGNLSGSGPPVSPTGSIESLPNNSTSSSGDGGGGGVGGGGRSSRSSSTERESTATDHVDHPVTPRAFSLDSARTAGDPDAHEQLTLPRPWSVAEPSRPSLDDAATDALAVRRHVTFLNALARIGRENSSLREQLGMRSTRSSEEEDGPPPVVAATAAPAPPELTALRNSQLSSATPTETALGGCGTARNGNDDRRSEGSSNSSGNDNGNDNNSNSATTPVAMPSTRPPMTVSEMVRERRHRQQREPQQQEQSQQQPQREQEDAPQRISPPLPLQPAIALADMEDAARGPNFSIAGGGRRLPRFRRHQRSGNAASTESTRESTESARRSTESTRRSAAIVDGIPRAPAPETRGFRWARPSPVDPATDTSTDGWRIASDIQTGFSLTNPRPDRAMSPDASGPNGSMFTTPSVDLSGRRFSFRRVPAGAGVDAHSNGTSNDSAAPMRRPRSRRVLRRRNSGWLEDESDRLLLASIPGSGGASAAATNSDGGREGGGAGGTSAEGGREGETAEESTRQGIAATIHQLHKASVVGDLTAISRFIKAEGDLEAQSFCGRTALHYAAFYGHADVARALILAGANVCSRGGGNSTPLHFAAWGGNKRVVRLLLDYGADVEARDTEGNAPQAYSEDDELYSMLVDARRKPLPLPASALSEALHARPFTTLATYAAVVQLIIVFAVATLFLAGTGGGSRWGALIGASPPQAATSAASSTGLAATAFRFSAGLGGKAAAAAARNAGVSGGEGAGGVGSVPMVVFISAFTLALLAGLAPALLYATGFKRRTQAYWRSMKDRDREIVHLRQREQAAGGWSPAFHIGTVPGTAGVATATTARAHSGAAVAPPAAVPAPGGAGSSFATQSPRNGGISRGEQAGQAVIARLSRLQAASAAAGIGGANPSGAGVRGLFGGDGPHVGQHLTMQQLQVQVQGYQQALMAMGGTAGGGGGGGGGSGQSSNAARRCVQVAQ